MKSAKHPYGSASGIVDSRNLLFSITGVKHHRKDLIQRSTVVSK